MRRQLHFLHFFLVATVLVLELADALQVFIYLDHKLLVVVLEARVHCHEHAIVSLLLLQFLLPERFVFLELLKCRISLLYGCLQALADRLQLLVIELL